jgi:hypothetical protein
MAQRRWQSVAPAIVDRSLVTLPSTRPMSVTGRAAVTISKDKKRRLACRIVRPQNNVTKTVRALGSIVNT